MNTYTLSNGFEIPVIGYGTWQNEDPNECINPTFPKSITMVELFPKKGIAPSVFLSLHQ